jgi:leucyl-tRNA synthetase
MAPHLGEEMHEMLGGTETVFKGPWPEFDTGALRVADIEYAVQVGGKVRGRFSAAPGTAKDALAERARTVPEVRPHLEGKVILKTVVVEGRLVNFVVR